MANRVVHFEIHATDPQKIISFYQEVFGWEIKQWEDNEYWLVMTGDSDSDVKGKEGKGIDGAILPRRGEAPTEGQAVSGYVCTIEVPDLDEIFDKVKENEGTIAMDKMEIPQVGSVAYFKDPDGNIFGVLQPVKKSD